MHTSSASARACCRRGPRSRSPCSPSCSSSWWCSSSTSAAWRRADMIEGALWRKWVFYNIPLILFVFVLLFPFYWMIITTFRPDGELYRPWNAANYMPFWTNNPTLEHITYLVPQTLLFIPLAEIIRNFELGDTPWSLILTYPTFLIPFCTWLMMGYFKAIPKELEE